MQLHVTEHFFNTDLRFFMFKQTGLRLRVPLPHRISFLQRGAEAAGSFRDANGGGTVAGLVAAVAVGACD